MVRLPELPETRPTIVRGSAVPSPGRVLRAIPPQFVVPVELLDPNTSFEWRVFVNYDPIARKEAVLGDRSDPPVGALDGGVNTVRLVQFSIQPPLADVSLRECYVIEFMVARSFRGTSAHTPDPTGGDTVTWFYNPAGTFEGCPTWEGESDAGGDSGRDV